MDFKREIDRLRNIQEIAKQQLDEINKEIKNLEDLQKEQEFNSFHRRIVLNSYTLTLNDMDSEYSDKIDLAGKLHSLVAMTDLCNWCNSKFPKKSEVHYHLNYDKLGDSLFSYEYFCNIYYSHFVFNSEESVELAIEEINKSPELTKFAKIFLGVPNES